MQEYGTVTAQIVTSAAQIPIPGATLTITQELPDGRQELLAVRMTNYDGFTEPFDVPTPPASRQPRHGRRRRSPTRSSICARSVRATAGCWSAARRSSPACRRCSSSCSSRRRRCPENYAETQEFDIPAQEL